MFILLGECYDGLCSILNYSLSQNCWDAFVSPCPLNVGVQGLVTEPR